MPFPGKTDDLVEVNVVNDSDSSGLLTVEIMYKIKVLELRKSLRERGLDTNGKKSDLRDRLRSAIERGTPIIDKLSAEYAANITGDEFDHGS